MAYLKKGSIVTQEEVVDVRQDILTLALKEGVQENSTKFNLPNSSIVQFQADADFNLAGSTSITRNAASEFILPSGEVINFAPPWVQITTHTDAVSTSTWSGGGVTNDMMGVGVGLYTAGGVNFGWDLATDWRFRGWFTTPDNAGTATGTPFTGGSVLITTDTSKAAGTTPSSLWDSPSTNTYYSLQDSEWADVLNTSYASTISAASLTEYASSGTTSSSHNMSGSSGQGIVRHYYNSGATLYGGLDVNYDASAHSMTMKVFDNASFTAQTNAITQTVTNISATGRAYIAMGEASGSNDCNFSSTHVGGSLSDYSSYIGATVSATGIALGTTNVPSSAVTEVSGVMLLKHGYGANTLGTDVKVYFTADNSAWTEASSYTDTGTFSTGLKMIRLGKTSCTNGSDVRWKIVWANQSAGVKEGHVYGIGLNY